MNKHTPGPWETVANAGRIRIRSASVEVEVCSVALFKLTDNTRKQADANLIAAAPDLLDALKGVLRVADRATVEFDAARAAIAKATGESP